MEKPKSSREVKGKIVSRTKGVFQDMPRVWNKRDPNCPKDAVYVGRPSKWGNPARIGLGVPRELAIELFKAYAQRMIENDPHWLDSLKGKDLVCWCAPLPCHADVLLKLANQEVNYG